MDEATGDGTAMVNIAALLLCRLNRFISCTRLCGVITGNRTSTSENSILRYTNVFIIISHIACSQGLV